MHTRPNQAMVASVLMVLLVLLGLTGCSDDSARSDPARSRTPAASGSTAGTPSGSSSNGRPAGSAFGAPTGYGCAGRLPVDEELFLVRDLQDTLDRPVRLRGVDLVGARGVTVVGAWAAPGRGPRVGHLSFGRFAGRRHDRHWAHRRRLDGARFAAGDRVAVLVHVEPTASRLTPRPRFRDLVLRYSSGGVDQAVRLGSGAGFGAGCPD